MKKIIASIAAVLFFTTVSLAWDLSDAGKTADLEEGQFVWFQQWCDDTIPVPGAHTAAEWQELFESNRDALPCGGSGIDDEEDMAPGSAWQALQFLKHHASDSDDPLHQRPESCG
ncbi:hypothetical protein [Desulfurispira natronophila]|uniref:Secreted protein n=1 Tax=Desulfurispira natronophila TaxID=682562 RepID=A0A7W7Y2C9_9BACT|nr:hypothetical protein [Desulfurispira natronophila]MBB5020815.1 hypothetical protein [Desulfurispira natronophila]